VSEFEVRGLYYGEWEVVYTATTREEARQILADYRENEKGTAFSMRRVYA
jgi:hypothetical protein